VAVEQHPALAVPLHGVGEREALGVSADGHNPFAVDGRQQTRLGRHRAGVRCTAWINQ
jgi:hypothetical protein